MNHKKVIKKPASPWTFRPDDEVIALWKELEPQVGDKTTMINEAIILYGEDASESVLVQRRSQIDSRIAAVVKSRAERARHARAAERAARKSS